METRTRSLIKTVIWRAIATLLTLGVVYFYTRQFDSSLKITLSGALLSMAAYYLHERVWSAIAWGRK